MVTTMARAVLGAFFITTLLSTAVLGQQMCYFPNGSPSPNDTPCRSSGFTHCCNNQSICLGNGFCQSVEFQPYTLSRGSCTDQTWQSPNCPQRCKGSTLPVIPTMGLPGVVEETMADRGVSSQRQSRRWCHHLVPGRRRERTIKLLL